MKPIHQLIILALVTTLGSVHAADTLNEAVSAGDKAKVEVLLSQGADVNTKDEEGNTALHLAGQIGGGLPGQFDAKGMSELLLSKGADFNARNKNGNTPLHAAANPPWGGGEDVVELLLSKGANANATNNNGQTPLMMANNEGVAKRLLAKGADINAKDNDGATPLYRAIYVNDKGFVALLLALGVDINVTNKTGDTPQSKAANRYSPANKEIRAMLENGALKQKPDPRELFGQFVKQLKSKPNDDNTRRLIMKLAQELTPEPAIPEEAEKFDGRAQYAFRTAKSEAEFLDAAREYLKAIEAAPWVANYYFNLCKILEKANRLAEAMRAGKLYLAAAPQAADAGEIKKLIAGLEYALERERASVVNRRDALDASDLYEDGAKIAQIGNQKISLKLYSVLFGGVWRNVIGIYDITRGPGLGQRFELDPIDTTFQLDDTKKGTPWFHLTIGRDGQITFGGNGSAQAEIVTSTTELNQLRNEQLKHCLLVVKEGSFFIQLGQGGPVEAKNGALVHGALFFASDCKGNLQGEKPGWFPAMLRTGGDIQGFSRAPTDACQQERARTDNLGWLSE